MGLRRKHTGSLRTGVKRMHFSGKYPFVEGQRPKSEVQGSGLGLGFLSLRRKGKLSFGLKMYQQG